MPNSWAVAHAMPIMAGAAGTHMSFRGSGWVQSVKWSRGFTPICILRVRLQNGAEAIQFAVFPETVGYGIHAPCGGISPAIRRRHYSGKYLLLG